MRIIRVFVEKRALRLLPVLAAWLVVGGLADGLARAQTVGLGGAEPDPSDVTLRSSTGSLILFDYHPGEPTLVPWSSDDVYEALELAGAEVPGSAGAPALPARRVAFGVPHGATLELRVLGTGNRSLGEHRLIPVARWEPPPDGEGLGRAVFEEDSSYYESDLPYPEGPARIILDSVFRGQRIVVVELVPFRYRPASGSLEFIAPMTVALDISGGEPGAGPRGRDLHEAWLEKRILNYESARSWRERPARRDARKADGGFEQGTEWVKLGITEKGMYRVTGSMLAAAGWNLSSIDPGAVRLFSGGGRPLPEDLDYDFLNDAWMEECGIWVRDRGTAGVLDAEDEIIFSGLGAQGWASDFDARV